VPGPAPRPGSAHPQRSVKQGRSRAARFL
jgi:hypothetical protein